MINPKGQMPVFLLTGFLGAGKTTLLNRMLENPALKDTALVINEFGLVAVDHDLVREGSERPVVTTGGCICCTVGSDLRSSLDTLLNERARGKLPPFSRVIVETTGLADPAPIVNSLIPGGLPALSMAHHSVARAFRLSSVITVIDATGIEAALAGHPESLRQIAFADHLVMTRAGAHGAELAAWLRALNPSARIHDGDAPGFDPVALLAEGSYSAFGKGEGVEEWLAAETAQAPAQPSTGIGDFGGIGGHFHDLNRHGAVRAIPLLADAPVAREALEGFLRQLCADPGNGLLRLKGLVALREDPAAPAVVHSVGHKLYPLRLLPAWPGDGRAQTRLVLIGTHLDETAIRRRFATLFGPSAAGPLPAGLALPGLPGH